MPGRVKLRTLYAFVGGFYTYSIFALVFWETRRRDFVVSMTHHISSVTLVCVSYIFRFVLSVDVLSDDNWLAISRF